MAKAARKISESPRGLGLSLETELGHPRSRIIGVDEVGRGCLFGPVVTAAAVLPRDLLEGGERPEWLGRVRDSKLVREEEREELEALLKDWLEGFAVGEASPAEIDSLNIHHATLVAMERAVLKLEAGLPEAREAFVLVDGKWVPPRLKARARAVIKGDRDVLTIACASILAKVHRDRLMADFAREFPHYGLREHKGYPTPAHQRALAEFGVTAHHRRSFGPVRAAIGNLR